MTAQSCECSVPFGCYKCRRARTRLMWVVLGSISLLLYVASLWPQ